MSETPTSPEVNDQIKFVDYYQTPLNAGTYEVTATLTVPDALKDADISTPPKVKLHKVKLHVAGPRLFLPPSEIHSVFPPENGAGDYNNILPHIVLNRRTLPWERLVDKRVDDQNGKDLAKKERNDELEKIPFIALLVFSDDEEANGDVTPPTAIPLADLLIDFNFKYVLEPGEKLTDKVSVIDIKPSLLEHIMPTGEELKLLAHGREQTENGISHQRAVIIAKRLPAPPLLLGIIPSETSDGLRVRDVQKDSAAEHAGIIAGDIITHIGEAPIQSLYGMTKKLAEVLRLQDKEIGLTLKRAKTDTETEPVEVKVKVSDRDIKRRNIAHLVMLENCFNDSTPKEFNFPKNASDPVRLVCLKSWQFNCTTDEPTLRGRLLSEAFTFKTFCVPEPKPKLENDNPIEPIRLMSYAALPYHLRWGDRAHTLYHGPLVAATSSEKLGEKVPTSADGLVRLLQKERIFDVSLAAAWQLGQMLMLRDQSVAMEYFSWRRHNAQLRARQGDWKLDGHLHIGDDFRTGLTPIPKNVKEWCQERLKLRSLPFEYLVPDARMLPENSLRIFRIHAPWMECLLSGALAVGRGGEADRMLEVEYRSVVYPDFARGQTGFLLRSPAVEEHPDLKVVAEGTTSEVRLERIGPGLLLGLYSGTFSKLQFSLPPIGLHFGFKEEEDGFAKDVKNPENGKEVTDDKVKATLKDERVVKLSDLRNKISEKLKSQHIEPSNLTPGSFAFQMCEGTESVEFGVG